MWKSAAEEHKSTLILNLVLSSKSCHASVINKMLINADGSGNKIVYSVYSCGPELSGASKQRNWTTSSTTVHMKRSQLANCCWTLSCLNNNVNYLSESLFS